MHLNRSVFLICTACSLLLGSCANIMAPTGGPRDSQAPHLKKRSMADSSLQVHGGTIELEFDEMVQVKDANREVVVSPLLKKNPELKAHRKKVIIRLQDSLLLPNTTYTIMTGNAIQDVHEGNPFPPMNITFSTGTYFDSLTLHGTITDAATGLPDTTCWVVLYPSKQGDSVFLHEKPMYVQKASQGSFRFTHLPQRSFTLYALQDLNQNLHYDAPNEKMAFYDHAVLAGDTTGLALYSFSESQNKDSSSKKKGNTLVAVSKDQNTITRLSCTANLDTLHKTNRSFDLNDTIRLVFDHPFQQFDTSHIHLTQNEQIVPSLYIARDTLKKNTLLLYTHWQEASSYELRLQKGFVKDSSGIQGSAMTFPFMTRQLSDYGTLRIHGERKENDWIELLRKEQVVARKAMTDTMLVFPLLPPDTYRLRILHDANGNGLWDSGSFPAPKHQPEKVELYPPQIILKANWENTIDLLHPAPLKK